MLAKYYDNGKHTALVAVQLVAAGVTPNTSPPEWVGKASEDQQRAWYEAFHAHFKVAAAGPAAGQRGDAALINGLCAPPKQPPKRPARAEPEREEGASAPNPSPPLTANGLTLSPALPRTSFAPSVLEGLQQAVVRGEVSSIVYTFARQRFVTKDADLESIIRTGLENEGREFTELEWTLFWHENAGTDRKRDPIGSASQYVLSRLRAARA